MRNIIMIISCIAVLSACAEATAQEKKLLIWSH